MSETDTSADFCYRHPDRQSWVLCQRCGRTVCPECQTPAPVGVQCPDCVREGRAAVSGGARASGGRGTGSVTVMRRRPAWWRSLRTALTPGSGVPVVSISVAALAILLFVADALTRGALSGWMVASSALPPWQLWRFLTNVFVQGSFSSLLLGMVFFLLIGITLERTLGRLAFVTVLAAGVIVGTSTMLIAFGGSLGLGGAMFGMFAAYFVLLRRSGGNMLPFLLMMVINVVLTLMINPIFLVQDIGGVIGGGGAMALLQWHEDRGTRPDWKPYLQVGLGAAGFMALALIRPLMPF